MDEPLVETELADTGPQRRSGPWKLIAIVAVVTVIGVWLVPGDAPDDEPAMTPRAPGIISRDEPGPDTARSLLPGLPEDTQPSAPPAEPAPAVDDRPGAKARAMIASLRTTGDIKLDAVFAAAEQAQSIGELADAYLLYFFAAREGYAPAALALGKQLDFSPRADYVLSLLYLAVFGSAVAFGCYLALLRLIGAARASYSSVLFPVVALLISTAFEEYRWTITAAIGILLTLAGNWLILSQRKNY